MKASWTINYWKSGQGYSHSETVEWTREHNVLSPEDAKNAVLAWWYDAGWTDTEYDGHNWVVNFYEDNNDPMFSDSVNSVEFWVDADDIH